MNYCVLNGSGLIENIIVCASDEIATQFGAVPFYGGAKIGEVYSPPPDPPTLEDRVSTLETETADLNEALNMILTGVTE